MSYLAWPVTINGKMQSPDGEPFHMTLKYLGKFPMLSIVQIKDRLVGHDVSPVTFFDKPKWAPEIWQGRDLKTYHVLELTNPPERMALARGAFADIRKDDFREYRPHISVPEFWWQFMQRLGPGHVMLELGPLALMGLT